MNVKERKLLKYFIAGCIGFMFLILISNNNIYAKEKVNISFKKDSVVTSIEKAYTGGKIKPKVYVKTMDRHLLTEGTSYTVSYPSNPVNCGWYEVTVKLSSKYTANNTTKLKYRIKGIQVNEVSVSLSRYTPYTYDGNVHRPKVSVYCRGWQLTEGVSYTLSCTNGIYAGTHSITVNLKGGYEGWIRKTYTINKADMAHADIRFIESSIFTYTGGAQYPEFRVYFGSRTLGYGDFTWSFPRGNITAGEKIIRITGCGNYTGYKDTYYTIKKRSISGGSIQLHRNANTGYTYTGGQIKPGIDAVYMSNGKTKVYDYSVSYGTNVNAGQGWIKVTGTNNNTGSITKYFTINKRNISGGDVYLDKNSYTYTGNQIKPTVTGVYMPNHTTRVYDYYISRYGTNKNSGQGYITVTGKNNNTGSITKYFTIDKRSVAGGRIELKSSYSKKAAITKNDIEAVYTKSGTKFYDYKIVSSTINSNKTKATITIEGTSNNTGKITQSFNIGGVQAILDSAKKIQKEMYDNHYEYCLKGSGCEHYGSRNSCGLTIDYADSKVKGKYGYHNTCCATFVSWVLIDSGVVERWELLQGSDGPHCASVSNYNYTGKFKEIYHPSSSDIKAGDLLIYGSDHHHIEIAAQNGTTNGYATVYNAGSYSAINNHNGGTMKAASPASNIDVILRLK